MKFLDKLCALDVPMTDRGSVIGMEKLVNLVELDMMW